MNLKTLRLYRLRNTEFYQFFTQFSDFITQYDLEVLNIANEFTKMSVPMQVLKHTHNRSRTNSLTEELKAMDKERNVLLSTANKVVKGNITNYNEAVKTDAALLYESIKTPEQKIGTLVTQNYATKTANLNQLLTDWKATPEHIAALENLNLTDTIERLTFLNTTFNTLYEDRTKEFSEVSLLSNKELRKEIIKYYYSIGDLLDVYHERENTEESAKLISDINALISQYNTSISLRIANANVSV